MREREIEREREREIKKLTALDFVQRLHLTFDYPGLKRYAFFAYRRPLL